MAGGCGVRLEQSERLWRAKDAAKRKTRCTTTRATTWWSGALPGTLGHTSILDLKILQYCI